MAAIFVCPDIMGKTTIFPQNNSHCIKTKPKKILSEERRYKSFHCS
jgi:hypothetical protein